MFVASWNCIPSTVVVILFTKSAVPICPPALEPNPQPLFGLFGSAIVTAAALTIVRKLIRSCTAGVAIATCASMIPVTIMVLNSDLTLRGEDAIEE